MQIDEQKIHKICQKNHIAFLGIFGSAARDEMGAKSDIDLLVRYEKPISLFDHSGVALDLEAVFGRKVDLVTERSLNKYIKSNIYRDLKPLYGQSNA